MKKTYLFLLLLASFTLNAQCWFTQLTQDLANGSAEFKTFVKNSDDGLYAYQKLFNANKTKLKTNIEALNAFIIAKNNPKLLELGFTDDLLASINGATSVGYAELLTNLNKFANNLTAKNITLVDFNKIFNELYEVQAKREGANWIIKYIANNSDVFKNKTIKF